MNARLKSSIIVSGLIRAVEARGGSAMVLRKGEGDSGSIAITLLEEGRNSHLFECQYHPDHGYQWIKTWTQSIEKKEDLEVVLARKTARDPDIWVVELHIPNGERFIADWSALA